VPTISTSVTIPRWTSDCYLPPLDQTAPSTSTSQSRFASRSSSHSAASVNVNARLRDAILLRRDLLTSLLFSYTGRWRRVIHGRGGDEKERDRFVGDLGIVSRLLRAVGRGIHPCTKRAISNFAIINCGLRQYAIGPTNHRHRRFHQS
jgi:hypothetical protein